MVLFLWAQPSFAVAQERANRGSPQGIVLQEYLVREDVRQMLEVEGPVYLLRLPRVQIELNVTQEQIKKLAELVQEEGERRLEIAHDARERADEAIATGTRFDSEAARRLRGEARAKLEKEAASLLTRAQHKRLREIRLQVQGMLALVQDAEISEELLLSGEQAEAIRSLSDAHDLNMKKAQEVRLRASKEVMAAEIGPPDEDAVRVATLKLRQVEGEVQRVEDAANKQLRTILSKAQERKLKVMLGKPFAFENLYVPPGKGSEGVPSAGKERRDGTGDGQNQRGTGSSRGGRDRNTDSATQK
jgi:hypothetical protein